MPFVFIVGSLIAGRMLFKTGNAVASDASGAVKDVIVYGAIAGGGYLYARHRGWIK